VPKKIDHAARRLELAEALWRLTRDHGWEAISLRKVAAEAGVSMGMVQHYFTTKDEMLRFALEMISEDVRARIRARVAELPEPHSPRRLVELVLTEMLPQPSRRELELDATAVFIRRFMLKPESAATVAAGGAELKAMLTEQIRLAGVSGDAERDAGGLLAMLDGLMFAIVTGEQTAESAMAILRAQLDHVFGAERH
jgi:TetR/AcrR family transcriptional repressor of bet genes